MYYPSSSLVCSDAETLLARDKNAASSDSLIELVEFLLKNIIFDQSSFFCRQLRKMAIETKTA